MWCYVFLFSLFFVLVLLSHLRVGLEKPRKKREDEEWETKQQKKEQERVVGKAPSLVVVVRQPNHQIDKEDRSNPQKNTHESEKVQQKEAKHTC